MRKVLTDAVCLHRDSALKRIRLFVRSEEGVVTVEWVALAACMVVGAVVISFYVMHGLSATAQCIGNQLSGLTCP